jgi:hypothetical protein
MEEALSYCPACAVALRPGSPSCPLCGTEALASPPAGTRFPEPGPLPRGPLADKAVAGASAANDPAAAILRRARLDRFLGKWTLGLSFFLVALNVLTWPAYPWSLHPVTALLALEGFRRAPRFLPHPRGSYLVLMAEAILAAWLGATAFLAGGSGWFLAYAFPGLALAGSLAIGAITRLQDRPFKKAYAPLLGSLLLALLPLPLAVLAPSRPDRVFPGILFAAAAWTVIRLAWASRRWLRGEWRRKSAR